jgi:hypothetical protein
MNWSHMDILFRPKDHPEMELFKRNLLFMVKLPIGRHKVAKTLINNGASLNLIMRKTIIDMGLNLKDLTPYTICSTGSSQGSHQLPLGGST